MPGFGSLAPEDPAEDELLDKYQPAKMSMDKLQPPKMSSKWMMEPDLLSSQMGILPPGVATNDAGLPVDRETGEPVKVVRRPSLLPFTRTPEGMTFVKPKVVDIAGNLMGSPASSGAAFGLPGRFLANKRPGLPTQPPEEPPPRRPAAMSIKGASETPEAEMGPGEAPTPAQTPSGEPDWSRMNQPFGSVTDPVVAGKGLATIRQSDIDRGMKLAMGFSGGGLGTKGAFDPALKHDISAIKLQRPLSDVPRSMAIVDPRLPRAGLISPENLQGSVLMPVMGDRSAVGGAITHVGDIPLPRPVGLHGGPGYMAQEPGGQVWAAEQGPITTLANRVRRVSEETGKPVQLTYSAMGPRSADFSHHVSDTLSQMVQQSPITRGGEIAFNRKMRLGDASFDPVPNWPGVKAPDLMDWLRDQPGRVREKFAKTMDKKEMRDSGFPNVAEARYAITDPRLLNTKLGGSGLEIARADPRGVVAPSSHPTYSTGLGGSYTGSLGMSLPHEVMFPDIAEAYARNQPTSRFDYLASRGTAPHYQVADQRWLDRIMPHWLRGGFGSLAPGGGE